MVIHAGYTRIISGFTRIHQNCSGRLRGKEKAGREVCYLGEGEHDRLLGIGKEINTATHREAR